MRLRLLATVLGLLIISVCAGQGCAGDRQAGGTNGLRAQTTAEDGTALLAGLPPLPNPVVQPRSASVESDQTKLGSAVFSKSEFAQVDGDTLVLQSSPPAPLQYGIYEFPLGGNMAVRVTADIDVAAGMYFLAVANYAKDRWQFSAALDASAPLYELTPPASFASPGDAVYVAVIGARLDGVDAHITVNSLTLTSDDEVAPTFSISGTILLEGTLTPLAGVSVQLSPGDRLELTDGSGGYTFSGVEPGDYMIAPTLAGYIITPPTIEVSVVDADLTGQDFTGTENLRLYGAVLESGVTPIEGVTLNLVAVNENGSINAAGYRSSTTDAAGNYEFESMQPGQYRLIPQLDGWVFSPNIVEFTFTGTTPQGFTGTAVSLPATVTFDDHMLQWLFEPNCMQCHDSAKTDAERNFAPLTVNWDTYDGTTELSKTSANLRIQGDTMPPLTLHFKTTPFEKSLYQKWLDGGFAEN